MRVLNLTSGGSNPISAWTVKTGNKIAWLLIPRASNLWCCIEWPLHKGILRKICIIIYYMTSVLSHPFPPPTVLHPLPLHICLINFYFTLFLLTSPQIFSLFHILFLSISFILLFNISYPSFFPPPTFPHSLYVCHWYICRCIVSQSPIGSPTAPVLVLLPFRPFFLCLA
jgi:hypothetical protein